MADFVQYDSSTNPEARRKYAIAKFELLAHAGGPSSTFGATEPIYYLDDDHDPAEVIEAWIEVNAETLADRGLTTENISRALSKDRFKQAWRELRERRDFEVLGEVDYSDRGGGQTEDTECPFCGEQVGRLPSHLPCDGG